MSDAPERIFAEAFELHPNVVAKVPYFYVESDEGFKWQPFEKTEYIRADIHEARIKELEAQLEWQPIESYIIGYNRIWNWISEDEANE